MRSIFLKKGNPIFSIKFGQRLPKSFSQLNLKNSRFFLSYLFPLPPKHFTFATNLFFIHSLFKTTKTYTKNLYCKSILISNLIFLRKKKYTGSFLMFLSLSYDKERENYSSTSVEGKKRGAVTKGSTT